MLRLPCFPKRAALATLALAPPIFSLLSSPVAAQTVVQQIRSLRAKTPVALSPQARHQVEALEAEADDRTPAQRKVSSALLYSLKMARGEQIAPGVAQLRTGVQVDAAGLTPVDIDAAVTPDLLHLIVRMGGAILHASSTFGQVRARVPLSCVETLASLPGVRFIKPAVPAQLSGQVPRSLHGGPVDFLTPFVLPVPQRTVLGPQEQSVRAAFPALLKNALVSGDSSGNGSVTNTGSVTSEGDKAHQADKARSAFHVDGTGIKVGVLSDSIDDANGSYAAAVKSGDVSPVTVLSGQAGTGEGEGLAMLEIIHDLAPGAQLYFATGLAGEASMADNIVALQKAGCNIIVDDVSYFDESPFQDATIAKAVDTVTAAGALYFSSAANNGNLANFSSSVWEGDFTPDGNSLSDGKLHTFGTDSSGTQIEGNDIVTDGQTVTVSLFWSDPLGKSSDDYDLFVYDSSGQTVLASSTDRQTGSQDPYESVQADDGDLIAIVLHKGSTRFLHVDIDNQNSIVDFATNGRTRGHNAGLDTFSCAATDATVPYPDPFSTSDVVESFSNDGGRHIFYNPDGSAITSSLTHTGGTVLKKPDFTAADGVSTTLPAGGGLNPFYGTSAAAPHAGAIAALLLSYDKTLTRSQVASILDGSATDIMDSGYDIDAGYGILNALKALQNAPAPGGSVALSSVTLAPTSVTAGQPSTGKITLAAVAPTGGVTVTLQSSDTSSATVPSSVTIDAGDKTKSFAVTTKSVTSTKTVTITATLGSSVKTATLTVVPAAASVTVESLSVSPTSVIGGSATSTGTVTLSAPAPAGGLAVTQTTSDSSAATLAPTLNIPAGATSAKFKITTYGVSSVRTVTLTSSAGGVSKSATLTVTASTTAPTSLAFSPDSISSNGQSTGTVILSGAAPTDGAPVTISYQGTVVTTATVPAGETSTTFVLNFAKVSSTSTFAFDAIYNGKTVSGDVTVKATTVEPAKLTLSPSTVSGGGSTIGTVTLSATAPKGGAIVEVYQGDVDLGYFIIPGGQTTGSFTYTPLTVTQSTTYTDKAVYNGTTVTATLTVKP